ncbi:MAG: ADP-ribosylglycohydrolase family protein [Promethearchaeota archaeon]
MNQSILKSKFIGALLGTAVGDAIGMPFEGLTSQEVNVKCTKPIEMQEGRLPKGSYTDDTELAIGIAESLITNKGLVNKNHILYRFKENFNRKRGYGFGTIKILQKKANAKTLFGTGSYGNGAAMRIAPISFVYYDSPTNLSKAVTKCSEITHAHVLGIEGAQIQANAIAIALRSIPSTHSLDTTKFVKELLGFVKQDIYQQKLHKILSLLSKKSDHQLVIGELGNGVEAFNSVPSAVFSFLTNLNSFEDAVTYAVCLGRDTDTIAAMTGAISGAYLGVEAIPKRWIDYLENKDYIKDLAERLFQLKSI